MLKTNLVSDKIQLFIWESGDYETEQVTKSVSQIKQVDNLLSLI